MKTFLKAAAASIIIAFASTSAYAQDIKPYVGIGLGSFTTDYGSGFKSDASFGGFLNIGVDINPYIGAELRIGGVSSSNTPDPKVPNTTSKVSFISYLAKPQFPIFEQASVYGLIGATTAKVTVSAPGGTPFKKTYTQVSFGGGLEYKVQDSVSIGVEYVQYSNNKNLSNGKAKITGISATANYHF